jgi:hypothetical protein
MPRRSSSLTRFGGKLNRSGLKDARNEDLVCTA